MAVVDAFLEILRMPMSWAMMIIGIVQLLGPVWVAFLLGIMMGWVWKPRWATLRNCKFDFPSPPSPSSLLLKSFGSAQSSDSCKDGTAICRLDDRLLHQPNPMIDNSIFSSSEMGKEDSPLVTNEDLEHLCHLVERKDGGPPWKHMMDRSAQNMSYQAWQRDPQGGGPPQYCSRTVYEDATPELVRDFFWDDDFRLKWDDMVTHASILEECPTTGTMEVHWIRKFPFFCSDREYIIGRRIWESGRTYYCVTKGVPSAVPRKDKPRRVDLFYSSWFIQAVESRKGDGQLTACEVILFHHEDMGIPWEIAKFGVRQGMWGAVKIIERGFRAYQKHRASGAPLSRHAFMAQINTKLDPDYLKTLEDGEESSEVTELVASGDDKGKGVKISKLLIIGGAIAVACSLDRGLLTKTLIFGVARRFGNMGGRARS